MPAPSQSESKKTEPSAPTRVARIWFLPLNAEQTLAASASSVFDPPPIALTTIVDTSESVRRRLRLYTPSSSEYALIPTTAVINALTPKTPTNTRVFIFENRRFINPILWNFDKL